MILKEKEDHIRSETNPNAILIFTARFFLLNFAKNISILTMPSKAHILSELEKEILLLQGFRPAQATAPETRLGIIQNSFPNHTFPIGAVHEFLSDGKEQDTASFGFICGILSSLMNGAPAVWVSPSKQIFPPALAAFDIAPHHFLFIQAKKPKEALWVVEEALKTEGVAAVVGEVADLSFLQSRRLQLAVEQSKVTGFLVRQQAKHGTTACVARWKIRSLPSAAGELPGIGFPRWQVQLLKIRNGKPGSWQIEWRHGRFELLQQPLIAAPEIQRKAV